MSTDSSDFCSGVCHETNDVVNCFHWLEIRSTFDYCAMQAFEMSHRRFNAIQHAQEVEGGTFKSVLVVITFCHVEGRQEPHEPDSLFIIGRQGQENVRLTEKFVGRGIGCRLLRKPLRLRYNKFGTWRGFNKPKSRNNAFVFRCGPKTFRP